MARKKKKTSSQETRRREGLDVPLDSKTNSDSDGSSQTEMGKKTRRKKLSGDEDQSLKKKESEKQKEASGEKKKEKSGSMPEGSDHQEEAEPGEGSRLLTKKDGKENSMPDKKVSADSVASKDSVILSSSSSVTERNSLGDDDAAQDGRGEEAERKQDVVVAPVKKWYKYLVPVLVVLLG